MNKPKLLAIKIRFYIRILSNPEKYKIAQERKDEYIQQLIQLLPVDRIEINGETYGTIDGIIWNQEEIMKYRNILLGEF